MQLDSAREYSLSSCVRTQRGHFMLFIQSCCLRSYMVDKKRLDNTRPNKIWQDRTRLYKTRLHKTRQDQTRPDKTRQDKTRQDRTRAQDYTIRNNGKQPKITLSQANTIKKKTRQDKPRHDNIKQARPDDKTAQDKTRQSNTKQNKTRQETTRQETTRQDINSRQDKKRHDTARQINNIPSCTSKALDSTFFQDMYSYN